MMEEKVYDVLVIGGGPAGYYCALHCSRGGLKVALVEKEKLGGTGLRWGCLPVKKALDYVKSIKSLKKLSITPKENFRETMIGTFAKKMLGIEEKMESNLKEHNIDLYFGGGKFVDENTYVIETNIIKAKNIVIATGTEACSLKNIKKNETTIITHKEAIDFENLPSKVIIVGGNVEGCEFASLYAELGVEVVLIEKENSLLKGNDADLVAPLESYLMEKGVEIYKGFGATEVVEEKSGVKVTLEDGREVEGEKILITMGRKPNFPDGIEKLNLAIEKDKIVVDSNLKTNIPNIYAIGDINGILGMAHVAIQQGIAVANHILYNKMVIMNYEVLPRAIFTIPEIAGAGAQEDELVHKNIFYKKGYFSFSDTWRGFSKGMEDGFVKVLIGKDNRVLGVWMVGEEASELVGLLGVLLHNQVTTDEIINNLTVHPSLSEAFMEAILNAK
ncbi:MAG: NAD(P)/FAD-dependent oxidoreductase [Clostridiaceae bacterium]|nr:NAD(P)/FAD-dependent oxidoreductase [Clostridiaceae bacterium]